MFKKKNKEQIYKIETNKEEAYLNKERKELPNPLKGVKFWALAFGAAALIALGLWILLDKNLGTSLALGITGLVVVIMGIIRIIPLIRTQKSGTAKALILVEIVIDIAIGAFLFYAATAYQKDNSSSLGEFTNKYYRFFLGAILYLKGVFYFINTSLLKERTNKFEFWFHIVVMTIGAMIFALNFDAKKIGIIIAVISLIFALILIVMGGSSYYNYRKSVVKPKEEKKEEPKEEQDEQPILDQEEEHSEVNVQ